MAKETTYVRVEQKEPVTIEADDVPDFLKKVFYLLSKHQSCIITAKYGDVVVTMHYARD